MIFLLGRSRGGDRRTSPVGPPSEAESGHRWRGLNLLDPAFCLPTCSDRVQCLKLSDLRRGNRIVDGGQRIGLLVAGIVLSLPGFELALLLVGVLLDLLEVVVDLRVQCL